MSPKTPGPSGALRAVSLRMRGHLGAAARQKTAPPPFHPERLGITLFEVVLALAIFIGAFAAISQILRTGSMASVRASLTSEAAVRCDRRMNEILAGIEPMQSGSGSFSDDSKWVATTSVVDGGVPGLLQVEVTVEHKSSQGKTQVSRKLTRLIRDPQVYVDAALSAAAAEVP